MINIHIRSDFDASILAVQTSAARGLLRQIAKDKMAGWFDLPEKYDKEEVERIKEAAAKIQQDSDYLVCIGIGGSYLGHRAVIDALESQVHSHTKILYAGNSLSTVETQKVLDEIGDKDFSVNVISKSGTTTEPAIAFRIFKQKLFEKYGENEAFQRIYVTTDKDEGALHDEALYNHYTSFVVPDDVGGRYSVLTAVGLFPIAVAGIDIEELLSGAREESAAIDVSDNVDHVVDIISDDIFKYAAYRHILRSRNYDVEVLASFEPCMRMMTEWWKQLFGESEGKENQGIFPANAIYSTDLHSLGQYMQQGRPNIFETIVSFRSPVTPRYLSATTTAASIASSYNDSSAETITSLVVPEMSDNLDGLEYLENRDLDTINKKAQQATIKAHARHIPVVELELPDLSARSIGSLIYFFETACAISACFARVNPFDQPGVEEYKKEMFKLLGKPGYVDVPKVDHSRDEPIESEKIKQ